MHTNVDNGCILTLNALHNCIVGKLINEDVELGEIILYIYVRTLTMRVVYIIVCNLYKW